MILRDNVHIRMWNGLFTSVSCYVSQTNKFSFVKVGQPVLQLLYGNEHRSGHNEIRSNRSSTTLCK